LRRLRLERLISKGIRRAADDGHSVWATHSRAQPEITSVSGPVQTVASGQNWATTAYGVDLGWFEARGFSRLAEISSRVRPTFWTLKRTAL
jgi:hypothetical protein